VPVPRPVVAVADDALARLDLDPVDVAHREPRGLGDMQGGDAHRIDRAGRRVDRQTTRV
jgi:hypothetical protein